MSSYLFKMTFTFVLEVGSLVTESFLPLFCDAVSRSCSAGRLFIYKSIQKRYYVKKFARTTPSFHCWQKVATIRYSSYASLDYKTVSGIGVGSLLLHRSVCRIRSADWLYYICNVFNRKRFTFATILFDLHMVLMFMFMELGLKWFNDW